MSGTVHRVRRGLDLPLAGTPSQSVSTGPELARVALVADDFRGLRPRVQVEVGQSVRRGDVLLADATTPGIVHTSPGAGVVEAINRGARRSLQSIVVRLSESERAGAPGEDELRAFVAPDTDIEGLDRVAVRGALIESGLWTALRTRPFGRVPAPDAEPHAVFVTAVDTNPLSPDPEVVLADQRDDFAAGLRAVARLTQGQTFLCVGEGSRVAAGVDAPVRVEEFAGPHPAGLAGLHVHVLAPVGRARTVWTVGYQDVASIGRLFRTGHMDLDRVVALGGPPVRTPRLIRTRAGAAIADIARGEAVDSGTDTRWISGSVWSGKDTSHPAFAYLGRYDVQLTVLNEGGGREFLAWLAPGLNRYSVLPAFLSTLRPTRPLPLRTDTFGSRRAVLPLGLYERVMPMDILPTFLLRALAVGDLERAEELGCLELEEEDLALCTFVDPSKNDFGRMLRSALERIHAGA